MSLRGKGIVAVLTLCLIVAEAYAAMLVWSAHRQLTWLEIALILLCAPFAFLDLILMPYGVLAMGSMRLHKRQIELDALDETLADIEPDIAERKLREYVALKQGLGARIGMGDTIQAIDAANATYTLPDDDPRGLPRVQP